MTEIDRDSYVPALTILANAVRALIAVTDAVDVARMRQLCGQMEALAPVLEPTAYMRGGMDNLRGHAVFLAALDRFVTDVKRLDRTESDRHDDRASVDELLGADPDYLGGQSVDDYMREARRDV